MVVAVVVVGRLRLVFDVIMRDVISDTGKAGAAWPELCRGCAAVGCPNWFARHEGVVELTIMNSKLDSSAFPAYVQARIFITIQ